MSTAFVTGGSGFIGGRLILRLVEDGHTVRALARSEGAAARVVELGAEPVRGDVSDVASIAVGCQDAGPGGTWADFAGVNVEGTRHVIAACRKAGVRRLVHVGTEAALMAGAPLEDVDESAPLRPDSPAPYPATKAVAEQLVRGANDDELETVVIRPRFVWGAGDTSVLPELIAAVRVGRFAWISGGAHLTDTTHVDNAVEGLMLGASRGRPGEAYFVTDGEPVVFRDFVTELLGTQGITVPRRSLPLGVAKLLAEAGERVWKLLRRPGAPPLDYFTVWASGLQCTLDTRKARTELGYRPVRTRAEGFAELRS
jgi:nucleoside-diphosphate-sugar epimerase